MSDIEWTVHRIGETGFAGGYDVYALMEDGRELAYGPLERMQLMASAPALRSQLAEAESGIDAWQARCKGAEAQLAEAREALRVIAANAVPNGTTEELIGLIRKIQHRANSALAKLPEGR